MRALISTLLLVGGLILLLVNPPLFASAHLVGAICLAVWGAGLILAVILAILGGTAYAVAKRKQTKRRQEFGRDPFGRL